MSQDQRVHFYHSPQTRSSGVYMLLTELAADYELHLLNMKAGENRQPAYLAINPMGKVPAIVHRGELITEQVAIYQYLAEVFPARGLAPAPGEPGRGSFLRWLAFYGSSFEPAIIDRSMKRDPAPMASSPYGDFDTMYQTLVDHLSHNEYILGSRFSAADVLWGTSLGWTSQFGLVPAHDAISGYIQRVSSRPAMVQASLQDSAWAAEYNPA